MTKQTVIYYYISKDAFNNRLSKPTAQLKLISVMIKSSIYILILLSLTVLFYCGSKPDTTTTNQEIPEALQEDRLEISYKRSGDNLMEELYQELVDKTAELKKLEDDIGSYVPQLGKVKDKFDNYDRKSDQYYSSSENRVTSIADSSLRKRLEIILTSSKKQYLTNIEELNSLLRLIQQNHVGLNDHHIALKVILTLPIIERYQIENLINKTDLIELIEEQKALIKATNSLTPKF